jgi:hypothetical protein
VEAKNEGGMAGVGAGATGVWHIIDMEELLEWVGAIELAWVWTVGEDVHLEPEA